MEEKLEKLTVKLPQAAKLRSHLTVRRALPRLDRQDHDGSAARALQTLRLRAITGSRSEEGLTPLERGGGER